MANIIELKNKIGKTLTFYTFIQDDEKRIIETFNGKVLELKPDCVLVEQYVILSDEEFNEKFVVQTRKLINGMFKFDENALLKFI